MNNDMKLPEDKMCADCSHFRRCHGLFGCNLRNTECDWSPSRFIHKTMRDVLRDALRDVHDIEPATQARKGE